MKSLSKLLMLSLLTTAVAIPTLANEPTINVFFNYNTTAADAGSLASNTIVDNGPSENRIDMVFVGDGYTLFELSEYAVDASHFANVFFSEEPLIRYAPLFNIHRVDVISNESGTDNDPAEGVFVDTALDTHLWCGNKPLEWLLCVNVAKAKKAANNAPAVDHILVIANSDKNGGAGYIEENLSTVTNNGPDSPQTALHELGHSFANLADEYFSTEKPETYVDGEPTAANVSIYDFNTMSGMQTKWHNWIGTDGVDTYEGAHYKMYGIYRPTNISKMNLFGHPWGPVNTEQWVIEIYKIVNTIDSATAPGNYSGSVVLSVSPVQLSEYSLDVQWYVDGLALNNETATQLDVSSLELSNGPHQISVVVVDNTDWVRDEDARDQWMTSERSWSVDITDIPEWVCAEFIATNNSHLSANRAYKDTATSPWFPPYVAVGSNDALGSFGSTTTTIAETAEGYYELGECSESTGESTAPKIDSITANVNGTSVVVSGTASDIDSDLAEISVYLDGNSATTITASGTNNWSITFNKLSTGSHAAVAYAIDQQANQSTLSNAVSFSIEDESGVQGECISSYNTSHKTANRAYSEGSWFSTSYYAAGSAESLGSAYTVTILEQDLNTGFWHKVGSCN